MVMYFDPLKVLMPMALWMVGIGVVKAIVDMVRHPFYFPANTILLLVSGLACRLRGAPGRPRRALPRRGMTPASAAVSVAIIGPAHPLKGGVAVHTTELAHQLSAAGHEVDLISWTRMYPTLLYPGEVNVDLGDPETPLFEPHDPATLAWNRPDSWVRAGRGLGAYDLVVFVHVIPQLIPAYLAMIAAIPGGEPPPRLVVLAHNVLPHEPRARRRAARAPPLRERRRGARPYAAAGEPGPLARGRDGAHRRSAAAPSGWGSGDPRAV